MQIVHCVSSIDSNAGGPSRSIPSLCRQLAASLDRVSLLAVASPAPVTGAVLNGIDLRLCKGIGPAALGGSAELRRLLRRVEADLLHGHGLWQLPVHHMMQAARARALPAIISPRGMLVPQALQASRRRKHVAGWIFQNRDLHAATCIHATSGLEAESCRQYGLRNPLAVIPNGLELVDYCPLDAVDPSSQRERTLLFMSRIHPHKGLPYLLEAWSTLQHDFPGWRVVIAGNDDGNTEAGLRQMAVQLGVDHTVDFRGPVFGNAKLKLLREADLFVLPTHSENFGIVVAEALASGVPVVTSTGTPWQELQSTRSGWWVDVGAAPLRRALAEAMQLPDEERHAMGARGRRLIEEGYSIASVAARMITLYRWILEGGAAPDFVQTA